MRPERTCYDVRHYDLELKIDPGQQYLEGHNTITYYSNSAFDTIQVDLFASMDVDKITHQGKELAYHREHNAVFIAFPDKQPADRLDSLTFHYSGNPKTAENPPWDGGFVWEQDSLGNPWVGVAVQGLGASVWWPNKDHLSDEPDSMNMTFTVPDTLMCVSNGQMTGTSDQNENDNYESYHWQVSYPINNYNVTVNIAKYAHFDDHYVDDGDTLALDYYVLPYNLDTAKQHFQQVHGMLDAFHKYFGPYPYWEDGFALVETPYLGMEHQGAIAYGNKYKDGYLGYTPVSTDFDYIIIHEAGHEWFGNSISMSDLADLWIHEGFTTYSEALYVEYHHSYEKSVQYLNTKKRRLKNEKPIIGIRGVNHEGSGDMYGKGALMLNTLRTVVDDDEQWWSLIRSICQDFKHSHINTDTLVSYINDQLGTDYTYFFNQYVRHADIPAFKYKIDKDGGQLTLTYRWEADVPDFRMPVRVAEVDGEWQWLEPTTEWQTKTLSGRNQEAFEVDTEHFYIKAENVNEEEQDGD